LLSHLNNFFILLQLKPTMKILKYLLLLALLAVIGLSVYVATQKSEFEVKRSKFIKAQKSVVFSYVNDYRNWEDFVIWKEEDPNIVFTYADTTIGKGASYSWKGSSGEGKTTTIFEKENDSIAQKTFISGNEGSAYLTFKDSANGTKITWHSKGKLSFIDKIYATFKGGADKMIGGVYEKTLAKLDKVISYEMNTYGIKVNGIVEKTGGYYFQQKITCKISEAQKNINIILPNMLRFFKDNNIAMTGSPFVLYTMYDVANNRTTLSVCLPMKEEIYTSEGSDYTSGNLHPFQAVKTILEGDYSHSKEAWDKTFDYIKKNNLSENKNGTYIEVYSVAASQVKSPSKWITEIYIPVGNSTSLEVNSESTTLAEEISTTITKPAGSSSITVKTSSPQKTTTPVKPKTIQKPEQKEAKVVE